MNESPTAKDRATDWTTENIVFEDAQPSENGNDGEAPDQDGEEV